VREGRLRVITLIDLRPCQHDNGYMDDRSQIKVHTDERTQIYGPQSSLAVTHPSTNRTCSYLTSGTREYYDDEIIRVIWEEDRVQRCELVKGMKEESAGKKVDQFWEIYMCGREPNIWFSHLLNLSWNWKVFDFNYETWEMFKTILNVRVVKKTIWDWRVQHIVDSINNVIITW